MSHTVTVTTRTTTASSTAILLNTGILRSASGLLKLFETILGAICLGLIAHYDLSEIFFLLVSFGFLVTTFLLLVAFLLSLMSASIIPKTLFEFLYHLFAFVFYVSASVSLLIDVTRRNSRYYKEYGYEAKMAAAVLGLVNSLLYLLSTFFSFRTYRAG